MIKSKKNSGFSLFELIIYVAIIGGLLTAYISFSISTANFRSKIFAVNEVQNNARISLRSMSQLIRSASSLDLASSSLSSDPGYLVLHTSSSSTDPILIYLNKDNGTLQVSEGTSTPYALTSSNIFVTNLIFEELSSSENYANILIQLDLRYNFSDPYLSYENSFETNVNIRK